MQTTKAFVRYIPSGLLAASLLIVFMTTLAPGLTWANDGSDGGDLVTAAATGGIAHPTGYPLYLLVARLFQLLPFGSLAYRTNLLSAFATVASAVLVYKLAAQSTAQEEGIAGSLGGLAAGYAFGLAPLVWSQAVITEVYALQAFLILSILYLYALPSPVSISNQKRVDCWRGLLLGLAMCNHITTILLVPPAILLGSLHRKTDATGDVVGADRRWPGQLYFDRESLYRQLAWFGLGLTLYVSLPLRALAHPPVNWGNPVTWERFWWLVSGQLYQGYYLPNALLGLGERVQAWAALLVDQFGLPGLTFGLLGLVVFGRASRLFLLTTWMAFIFSAFAIFYRSSDSYVYLFPLMISFSIWIGIGVSGLARALPQRFSWLGLVFGGLMAAYFLGRAGIHFRQVDASQDLRADNFGREVLSMAPEKALVFAKGDQAVFALWYFHFALKERTDLAVIATDLLHFDWYQETIHANYPSLILPGPLPYPETLAIANPSRAVCYVENINQAEIDCQAPAPP